MIFKCSWQWTNELAGTFWYVILKYEVTYVIAPNRFWPIFLSGTLQAKINCYHVQYYRDTCFLACYWTGSFLYNLPPNRFSRSCISRVSGHSLVACIFFVPLRILYFLCRLHFQAQNFSLYNDSFLKKTFLTLKHHSLLSVPFYFIFPEADRMKVPIVLRL